MKAFIFKFIYLQIILIYEKFRYLKKEKNYNSVSYIRLKFC